MTNNVVKFLCKLPCVCRRTVYGCIQPPASRVCYCVQLMWTPPWLWPDRLSAKPTGTDTQNCEYEDTKTATVTAIQNDTKVEIWNHCNKTCLIYRSIWKKIFAAVHLFWKKNISSVGYEIYQAYNEPFRVSPTGGNEKHLTNWCFKAVPR